MRFMLFALIFFIFVAIFLLVLRYSTYLSNSKKTKEQ